MFTCGLVVNLGESTALEAQEVVLLCVMAFFPNLPKTDLCMTEGLAVLAGTGLLFH